MHCQYVVQTESPAQESEEQCDLCLSSQAATCPFALDGTNACVMLLFTSQLPVSMPISNFAKGASVHAGLEHDRRLILHTSW